MARLAQPPAMDGGVARWVTPDDVRALSREIGRLVDGRALLEWAESAEMRSIDFFTAAGLAERMHGDASPLSDRDRSEIASVATIALASRKCRETFGDATLSRCPACGRTTKAFYCDAHHGELLAEARELVRIATGRRRR
jgi:hypothetical protein